MKRNHLSALILGTACFFGALAAQAERPAVGDSAPALELVDTDGVSHTLSEAGEGPRIIIFFRGSW